MDIYAYGGCLAVYYMVNRRHKHDIFCHIALSYKKTNLIGMLSIQLITRYFIKLHKVQQ
jgi:hypothetical protein